MITNVIVFGAIALAVLYFVTWMMRRDFREQIERPKHRFQDQINSYDRQLIKQKNKG
ncbi:hypothetical protein JYT97_02795 [Haliea sp. AH-315-K21]|nr:hypothetical protein [Haliea sp. AH-315-K21]